MCTILVKFFERSPQYQPVLQLSTLLLKVCTSFFVNLVTGLHNSIPYKSSIQPSKSTSNILRHHLHHNPITVLFNSSNRPHLHYVLSLLTWKRESIIDQLAIFSLLPCIGPLHISLNDQETLFNESRDLFELIYTKLFPKSKLAKIAKPWRISLLLKVACGGWLYIRESVKEKFIACKDIK